MKKKLFILVFIIFFIILSSRAFVALFSYQMIEKLKHDNQDQFALTYGWISSDFSGFLTFHDVTVTPYSLKRTFNLNDVELHYSDYLSLLLRLQALNAGDISALLKINAPNIKIPLNGRDFDEWLALTHSTDWLKPLGLYACGDRSRIDHDSLRAMGIDEISSAVRIERLDGLSQVGNLGLSVDLFQLGKIDAQVAWGQGALSGFLQDISVDNLRLDTLKLIHNDGGYFRRLSNYCSESADSSRSVYSRRAAQNWRVAMYELGFVSDLSVENLYSDYLSQGGTLAVHLDLPEPFNLSDFSSLKGQDLMARFGVSAYLNEKKVDDMHVILEGDHFWPPAPVISAIEKPVVGSRSPQLYEAEFRATNYDDLLPHIGREIKITMEGGKLYSGVLKDAKLLKLIITQNVGGGSIDYTLKPHLIEEIEVWRAANTDKVTN